MSYERREAAMWSDALYGLQAMHFYPQRSFRESNLESQILESQIVPICCLGRWCQTHFSPVTLIAS